MKKSFFTLVIAVLMINSSCKKEDLPEIVADFNFSVTGYAPAQVTFTNNSVNADSFLWNFGDGSTSTEKNPVKIFNSAGIYDVTLTSSGNSASNFIVKRVSIAQQPVLPVANFTFQYNSQSAPATVLFTNQSLDAISYNWAFADGTFSTEINPNHSYSAPGSYAVILTAINNQGTNTCTHTISITEAVVMPVSVEILAVSVPVIDFNYAWDVLSGPDVFYKYYLSNVNAPAFDGNVISDVSQSNIENCIWPYASGPVISDLSKRVTIKVFDYDYPDADDLMCSVEFNFASYISGSNAFPEIVSKTVNGMKVNLILQWNFQSNSNRL